MIISAIIYVFYGFVWTLLQPLRLAPDVSLPANVSAAVAMVSQYLNLMDVVLPVSSLLAVVGAFLTIEAAILGYKVIMWAKKLIW